MAEARSIADSTLERRDLPALYGLIMLSRDGGLGSVFGRLVGSFGFLGLPSSVLLDPSSLPSSSGELHSRVVQKRPALDRWCARMVQCTDLSPAWQLLFLDLQNRSGTRTSDARCVSCWRGDGDRASASAARASRTKIHCI